MNAVHFGAGLIGRGFIGSVLRQSGYQVCFVDIDSRLVEAINRAGRYTVNLAADAPSPMIVDGVRALHASDATAVAAAVADADLVTTAVGPSALAKAAPLIAAGLAVRLERIPRRPLDIIACENLPDSGVRLRDLVQAALTPAQATVVAAHCGFPGVVVDRIVPLQRHADPLTVTVEPFHEWIIDRTKLAGRPPALDGARLVDDIAPFFARKFFTVNTGHACAAYLGFQAGHRLIDEVLRDPGLRETARLALEEAGTVLTACHGFARDEHTRHIEATLARFANRHLADEVVRVGRAPLRKLRPEERLVAPARQALARGVTPGHLARVIAAVLRFDAPGDPESMELLASLRMHGPELTLTRHTGLPVTDPLHRLILTEYRSHA